MSKNGLANDEDFTMIKHLPTMLAAAASVALTPCVASRAEPADIDKTIVFIHCATKDGKQIRGSGVLVSERGHVLTAGHVVKDADKDKCYGSIGFANADGGDPLIMQTQAPPPDDAALLRFNKPGPYEYVRYCQLEDWMVRRDIYAAGYPGDTKTGTPSYRKGVLSSVFPNSNGVLETDSQTVAGMSGGPVFASDLKSFIGIVVGAQFDPLGTVSYYGNSSTEGFKDQFHLTPSNKPCYHRTRDIPLPPELTSWKPSGPAESFSLGVRADEGFCFLSGIRGIMNDTRDAIKIEVKDDQYYVVSESHSGSEHGADVRCNWYQ